MIYNYKEMSRFNEAESFFTPQDAVDTAEAIASRINNAQPLSDWDAKCPNTSYNMPSMTEQARTGTYYVVSSEAELQPKVGLPYFEIQMMAVEEVGDVPNIEDAAKKSQILTERIPMNFTRGYPLEGGHLIFNTDQDGRQLAPMVINRPGALELYFSEEAIAERIKRRVHR